MRTDKNGIKILPEMNNNRAREIRKLARRHGWEVLEHKKDTSSLSFTKECERITVYYSERTVVTFIKHPVKGYTQLFRKDVGLGVLEKLFINPRFHSGVGRY